MQQRGWGALSAPEERRERQELISARNFSKQRLERQMGQQRAGDKSLHEMVQKVFQTAHLLSQ
jgi:hypothetical protein